AKGPRSLEVAEGDGAKLGLDEDGQIIGYEFVQLGRMMDMIKEGKDANEALAEATGTYGRFADAVSTIDPRKE
nr:hypothetical protein [Bacteroidales bacterium]